MAVEELAKQIETELGESWLPTIYRERVLKIRTRSYHFEKLKPGGKVAIQHTLLGVELKIGKRRLMCPDLATARYLSIFGRAGCDDVAVPYDITKISRLADELESSWFRMLLLVDEATKEKGGKQKTRLRGLLFATIRAEILAAGAGTRIPEFKQSTKQRS
ncbi:MAG TPA: hypothetical protein VI306_20700 [Pyrinomonadaceae bacterium]